MRVFIYIIILVFFPKWAYPQNTKIDYLVSKIVACQITDTNSYYSAGLFPSQRIYLKRKGYKREDDNIFFTALTVWYLRQYYASLSDHNKLLADSICKKAIANYPNYQNKHGRATYNFWPTKPNRHFPNDHFFSSRARFALPDDLDDTVILYLSTSQSDSICRQLKANMAEYANGKKKWINNTFKKYKKYEAYNTWFGEKMDVEFDINVQCNAMLWVLDNDLPLNKYDSATILLINKMVLANEHIQYAHYVSPQYQKPAIVLYHLSRLVAAHPSYFDGIQAKLLSDLKMQAKIVKHPMEKLLLESSLARFNILTGGSQELHAKDFDDFYFFLANMTSVAPNPFKKWLAKSKWTNFYYQCEAYYWCLLLENECIKSHLLDKR